MAEKWGEGMRDGTKSQIYFETASSSARLLVVLLFSAFSDRMQEDHLSNLADQWIRGPLHQGSLTLGRDLVAS